MSQPAVLDHMVIDVRDRMREAVERFSRLGFSLTRRGEHSLGSINHLAIFADNYLELLGYEPGKPLRLDILQYPTGLNGLVFNSEDSAATYRNLRENDVAVEQPIAFFRPVDLGEGKREDARFQVVRLPAPTIPGVRSYFCQHFTKHLVWRDEWRSHPNGALNIERVIMVSPHPERVAATFRKMFGAASVHARGRGGVSFELQNSRIEILPPEAVAQRFGQAAPDPSGRENYLAALSIRTTSIAQTTGALAGIGAVKVEPDRVVIAAAEAFNTTLEFTAR
jgi:Glyoxalase-like domain